MPIKWCLILALCLIAPLALVLPQDVFALHPWSKSYTDWLARFIPMINRVVAYGHPHPDLLRCFLAYVWTTVPLMLWVVWRQGDKYAGPASWKPVGRGIAELVLLIAILAHFIYWPRLSLPSGMSGSLDPHLDERRRFFWSTPALLFSGPLTSLMAALMLDAICCNLRAALKARRATIQDN